MDRTSQETLAENSNLLVFASGLSERAARAMRPNRQGLHDPGSKAASVPTPFPAGLRDGVRPVNDEA